MNAPSCLLCILLAATPVAAPAFAAAAAENAAPKKHALRGVITRVDAEKSTLMVKHEEIPGFMRAMTMQFKVDPKIAAAAKAGQSITGQMYRAGNEWRLDDVKFVK